MSAVPPVGGPTPPPSGSPLPFPYTPDITKAYFDFLDQMQKADPSAQKAIQTLFNTSDPYTGRSLYRDYQNGDYNDLAKVLNREPPLPPFSQPTTFTPILAQTYFAFLYAVDQSRYTNPLIKQGIEELFNTQVDPNNPNSSTLLVLYEEGEYQEIADFLNQKPPQL